MNEERLPSIIFNPRREDYSKNQGGGDTKFYNDEWKESYRDDIVEHFPSIIQKVATNATKFPSIPSIIKVTMKEKAIAKSHKPIDLFNADYPIIGSGHLDELYVKMTFNGINKLEEEIKTTQTKTKKVNISKIKNIESYNIDEKISQSNIKEALKNNEKIKLKFFDLQSDEENQKSLSTFISNYVTNSSNFRKIDYSANLVAYSINIDTIEKLNEIKEFPTLKEISTFNKYVINSNTNKSKIEFDGEIEYPNDDIEYPIIAVVDSGISPNNKYIAPWIFDTVSYVPDEYQDNSHGTFVAGMILYGNIINNFGMNIDKCKLLNVVVMPSNKSNVGLTEEDLMIYLEDALKKYSDRVKIWNLSLGTGCECGDEVSDLAVFLDYLQEKYDVRFIISAGNYETIPLRDWKPKDKIKDRINPPADSALGITVGSIANIQVNNFVDVNCPSPFSRKGPGPNFLVKPDVVHYGGNCTKDGQRIGYAVKSFDENGNIVEDIGTSFSAPMISSIFANIYNKLDDKNLDLLLAKALLINNSTIPIKCDDENIDLHQYYGFGKPINDVDEFIMCTKSKVQMIFKATINEGGFIEVYDFPYPKSLCRNGKWYCDVKMTLAYNPKLDSNFGQEYCRTNVDVSLGTYSINEDTGEISFKGQIPLEKQWSDKYESQQVEHGFKWNPIKSYHGKHPRGVSGDGWKLRIECTGRSNFSFVEQEVFLIIEISDPDGNDIYSEIISDLDVKAFSHNELSITNRTRLQN